jgi:type I restriction enzyme R subunit
MKFNEDSRVKIPTILHLVRLGYQYLSLKNITWDIETNIFKNIFFESIKKINQNLSDSDCSNIFRDLKISLQNEDLGRDFYHRLTSKSGNKIIDFKNINNNTFHVVTELTYRKDEEEFRPDITILINGLPLIFIEVKKPNNRDGIIVEQKRVKTRFNNKKLKNFANITQLLIFSNNMEYDDNSINILQGAFYATPSYKTPIFNYFREEEIFNLDKILIKLKDEDENIILKDTNLISIKDSKEFNTNKDPNTHTNRICTSLLQKERLLFLLMYGFAYLDTTKGIEKHIMRYPQLFASLAISNNLKKNIKNGIIWHTQGSGKTALVYFAVKILRDLFNTKKIISKFYFIVDRLDLLDQAEKEFKMRGLSVFLINSKEDFVKNIKSSNVIHNDRGNDEIILVNIQKFHDDPNVISNNDYNLNIQRIYFLDEVHRSYKTNGIFLSNLHLSDTKAIKIGLTGTPLLGEGRASKNIFGNYIHRYFYNSSIKDGYTVRLIREEIENKYKDRIQKILSDIKILKGNISKDDLYSHKKFVEPMLDYIIENFKNSRLAFNDDTIGGLIVCDSYTQAENMYAIFNKKYSTPKDNQDKVIRAKLILYDTGTKDDRKQFVEDFKDGKIDLLFVYSMLLTGFDSPRLKKIYFGRKIKSHNLLQALTRVNRPYKNFKYGYVVDFADIQDEFEKTNQEYFNELKSELGDEIKDYEKMFKSEFEIDQEINQIKDFLFKYETNNLEIFSQQISEINDRKQVSEIVKVLESTRELYNCIRISEKVDFFKKLDFKKMNMMFREASNRLALINQKESLDKNFDSSVLLNIALEDIIFSFEKIKEEELIMSDELKNILKKTRESLLNNFDHKDSEFIFLRDELERLFKKKNLNKVSQDEMKLNIVSLNNIYKLAKELERKNQLLKAKYDNDEKYARIHKRLMDKDPLTDNESKLFEALKELKEVTDNSILENANILQNESFVKRMISRLVIDKLKNHHQLDLSLSKAEEINDMIVTEYMNEFLGKAA